MKENVEDFDAFHRSIARALPDIGDSPRILDLGIGTGLELDHLFNRFPDATVTGIDLSVRMLDELSRKNRPWSTNLQLIVGSFLELDLGRSKYDAVISSMALHHWIPRVKLDLYSRVHLTLRAGGVFVNGDYVESEDESIRRLAEFSASRIDERHLQHIDLPLSLSQELELLDEAGFREVCVPFQRTNVCVFVASKI